MMPFARLGSVALGLCLSSQVIAQNAWTCPDDGSVTVATNSGTGNVSHTFTMSPLAKYDTTLKLVVFKPKSGTDPEVIVSEVEWTWGTDPTITLGPGLSVRIEDPADADQKVGTGTCS